MIDAEKTGQDRPQQNPNDYADRYEDKIHELPDNVKFPVGPQAPDPQPFVNPRSPSR